MKTTKHAKQWHRLSCDCPIVIDRKRSAGACMSSSGSYSPKRLIESAGQSPASAQQTDWR